VSYLCVDGGQTKTAVYLLDEEGNTIESWKEGPLTTPSKPGAADNLRAVVRGVCEELRRRLTRRSLGSPQAACFSLTGHHEEDEFVPSLVKEEAKTVTPDFEKVYIVPDYVGNWATATAGEPGIVLISGGGAVAYGRNASGDSLKVGGWGHLLGDEGSGYWIGLTAIKTVLRARAGMIPETELEGQLMARFRVRSDRKLLEKAYSGEISEAEIAGLVPLVDSLARQGDEAAAQIMEQAAAHLVELGATMLERLGELPIYLSGGVFHAPVMVEGFERLLSREAGHAVAVSRSPREPWEGIFLISKGGILD
jgi:N-acetylglucosamine kinase-like BadF-type ATPase